MTGHSEYRATRNTMLIVYVALSKDFVFKQQADHTFDE